MLTKLEDALAMRTIVAADDYVSSARAKLEEITNGTKDEELTQIHNVATPFYKEALRQDPSNARLSHLLQSLNELKNKIAVNSNVMRPQQIQKPAMPNEIEQLRKAQRYIDLAEQAWVRSSVYTTSSNDNQERMSSMQAAFRYYRKALDSAPNNQEIKQAVDAFAHRIFENRKRIINFDTDMYPIESHSNPINMFLFKEARSLGVDVSNAGNRYLELAMKNEFSPSVKMMFFEFARQLGNEPAQTKIIECQESEAYKSFNKAVVNWASAVAGGELEPNGINKLYEEVVTARKDHPVFDILGGLRDASVEMLKQGKSAEGLKFFKCYCDLAIEFNAYPTLKESDRSLIVKSAIDAKQYKLAAKAYLNTDINPKFDTHMLVARADQALATEQNKEGEIGYSLAIKLNHVKYLLLYASVSIKRGDHKDRDEYIRQAKHCADAAKDPASQALVADFKATQTTEKTSANVKGAAVQALWLSNAFTFTDRDAAEKLLLKNQKDKKATCIFRCGSQSGYVMSYITPENTINHVQFTITDEGYSVGNEKKLFKTLDELQKSSSAGADKSANATIPPPTPEAKKLAQECLNLATTKMQQINLMITSEKLAQIYSDVTNYYVEALRLDPRNEDIKKTVNSFAGGLYFSATQYLYDTQRTSDESAVMMARFKQAKALGFDVSPAADLLLAHGKKVSAPTDQLKYFVRAEELGNKEAAQEIQKLRSAASVESTKYHKDATARILDDLNPKKDNQPPTNSSRNPNASTRGR